MQPQLFKEFDPDPLISAEPITVTCNRCGKEGYRHEMAKEQYTDRTGTTHTNYTHVRPCTRKSQGRQLPLPL